MAFAPCRPHPFVEPARTRTTEARALCRHCLQACTPHRRGLCWRCYQDPAVRVTYEPVSPRGRHSLDFYGGYRLAEQPTSAPPGSPEKIAILAERVRLRQRLHHPQDVHLKAIALATAC